MIQISEIELLRGGKALLKDASATLFPEHKVGLVGANGCGKSTLFSLLKSELQLDAGNCSIPKDWSIASVKQETPALDISAIDYVLQGHPEYYAMRIALRKAEQNDDGDTQAKVHIQLEHIKGYSIEAKAGELLHGLGFANNQIENPVSDFSGGWRMRLNLAQALIRDADLLLLDEPTNHLDLDAVYWLERFLRAYTGTLVLISHDREFLDAVVDQIWHIDKQKINVYKGNYSQFERQKAERLLQQQAMFEKQQDQIAHLEQFITRFKAKASKAKQAQSRVKALERMEKLAPAHADSPFDFEFAEPTALPNPLMTLDKAQAGYGDVTILNSIKLNLVPGSRIALLGRNGAGKSTLIKLLSGDLQPQAGEVFQHQGLNIGYFAQHQLESLDLKASAITHLQRLNPKATEQSLRDFLGGFAFIGDKALEPVAPFSGGEKARLVLAMLVYQKPNLLLLDEPTNHLDLEMRHALVMALQGFEGAMVTVSHDRHMLKNTADEYYLVDNGEVTQFGYDLDEYYQWLLNANKEAAKTTQDDNEPKANSSVNRKEQKRLEAEFRKATQPLKKHIEKLEKQLDKHSAELAEIEQALGDNELYNDDNKAKLKELLAKQATLTPKVNDIEEELLMALEEMEQKEQAFANELA
ncbi:ATP-binding cassette domain-containing protein [Pseudoalteromonas sp. SR44-5]|uniref:ATP-binding cassette domain-containing protein n=1 Tax=unclassified Pseudoalteromonas TaxID=194690 RepID=UPI0016007C6D|nr:MULTISPECIES: ATP-binding cassette domain-containing protein [unclassified Pseudoalteromonas]MBB1335671.1 ATP-binding cassette domain-containing protein [Pseudoalteromonas sp. SR41-6]MBB1368920.1 ATP-binding cassette domain-containing protein [Pseudoalteromonas sp. SR44-5]MBB1461221.1 ATP-binding cassette domain-containing protein [Pseudoalteromonas sp. SG41-8]